MKLYEIADAYATLQDLDDPDYDKALQELESDFTTKAENIGFIIKNLESEIDTIKLEIKRLQSMSSARQSRIDYLKSYLKSNMIMAGLKKIGLLVSIRLQDNSVPSCEIIDDTLIPDSFWRIIPETREVDKPLITEYWKSTQQQVPGANVYKGQHIRIG